MTDPIIGTNQCNHGNLRRSCEVCDLQARLAECERGNEQAERNYERARDSVLEAASHLKVCRFEVMGMTAERDTLRTQLTETQRLLEVQLAVGDKLEAEVARLKAYLEVDGDALKGKADTITVLRAELAALRAEHAQGR